MTQPTHPPASGCIFCHAVRSRRRAVEKSAGQPASMKTISTASDASLAALAAAEFTGPACAPNPDADPAQAILPQRRLAAGEFGPW